MDWGARATISGCRRPARIRCASGLSLGEKSPLSGSLPRAEASHLTVPEKHNRTVPIIRPNAPDIAALRSVTKVTAL